MTGSRVKVFGVTLTSVVFASCLAIAEEGPASGAPRGLGPATAQETVPAPVDAVPPAGDATELPPPPMTEEVLPDQVGKPQGPKVTVSGLEEIDPSGAGILDASSGGFPMNIYAGSPRAAIVARLSQLPAAPNSPAMQSLLRRILLSTTRPPAGATPADEPSLLAHRLRKLVAGGRVGEAAMLGAQSGRDDRFARQTWAEALLLQGRDNDACGDATSLRQSLNDEFWLKLRAYCYLAEGDTASATLTIDVMRERGIADDPFFSLAAVLTDGTKAKVDALPAPAALHIALLNRTRTPVPASLAGWLPARNVFLGGSDAASKLVALERAATAGLASIEDLTAAYNAEGFTPDQHDDPEEWAPKMGPTQVNALYFQAIDRRTRPAARAAAFAAALERADTQNRFALFAQVSRTVARQMPAVAETAWLAPAIMRVLLYNGDAKQAAQWLAMMTSPTDAPTVNAMRIHSAIVYPSAENLSHLPQAVAWLGENALKAGGSKDWLMTRALREVPLLDALGYTIPPQAQWALTAAPPSAPLQGPAGDAATATTRSAYQQRIGETVLNVLVAMGAPGPAKAPVSVVARCVDALATIGMRDEARAIAAEAVLGSSMRPSK
jgi:hypothetical protein